MPFTHMKSVAGILKILELVFVIVALGIYRGAELVFTADHMVAIDTLISGFYVSAIIITTILIICYLVDQAPNLQQTFLEPLTNFTLFVGLGASGGVAVYCQLKGPSTGSNPAAEGYSMAAMSFASSLSYLFDLVYSIYMYKK